jgi:hypothetical protein
MCRFSIDLLQNACIYRKKAVTLQPKGAKLMGQLAFLKTFILVAIPLDVNDNRRHIHVFKKGSRHLRSVAKIWIEKNGEKCIEIAESELTAKENNMIVAAIDRHWEFLNDQISKTFRGEKPQPKNIEK